MTTTTSPPDAVRRPVTVRLARWSATHPWRTTALWLAFVVAAVALMSLVPTQETTDADHRVGQSGRAEKILADSGLTAPPGESVVITAAKGSTFDRDTARTAADDVRTKARDVKGVKSVGSTVFSRDGKAALVPITMSGDSDEASDHVDALLDATAGAAKANPDVRVAQGGDASTDAQVNERVGEDLASGESLSLPITFVIMIIAFGALIAAGIPVLLAFTSVLASLGLYAPLSYLAPNDGTVSNVILLIGMAVGVDYSLFYLKREREERRRGHQTLDAVEIAAETSGRAVVLSGAAVMVSMAGLFLANDATFTSLAAGSITVVAVAVLGSLTVLPALLAGIGHWVDRPRVPFLWRLNNRIGAGGISGRLIRPVIGHPRAAAIASGVVLLAIAAPALGMKLSQGTIDTLPQDLPAVQALQRIGTHFPAENPGVTVVAQVAPSQVPEARDALHKVAQQGVREGYLQPAGKNAIRTSADGRTVVLTAPAAHGEGDDRNDTAVEKLRGSIVKDAFANVPHDSWNVGGSIAVNYDYTHHQRSTLPLVVGFVLILTLLMMWLTFRSLTIAVMTTVLNLLSVGAAFGVMTLVFQHSWADSLLGYTSQGVVIDWVPLFCFVVLVGLSMDYHVFVMSRVREGLRDGLPHWLAVEQGIKKSASVVTSAAIVMVSVFAVFASLSMVEMKQMGVGLSVAILLDATIVRLVLLPALLLLMEKRLGVLRTGRRRGVDEAPEVAPDPVA